MSQPPSGPSGPAPPDAGECVKVVVRCRPLSTSEAAAGEAEAVSVNVASRKVIVKDPSFASAAATAAASGAVDDASRSFIFDTVYPPSTSQSSLFTSCALPIVDAVLNGYNGTIFAYGQTGTGKTHTMEGIPTDPTLAGVIPRAFARIFEAVATAPADTEFLVKASFCEIYQDDVFDLLSSPLDGSKGSSSATAASASAAAAAAGGGGVRRKLQLFAGGGDRGSVVRGLSTHPVGSPSDLLALLVRGQRQRRTGETRLNIGSSRSHSVFTVIVESARPSTGASSSSSTNNSSSSSGGSSGNNGREYRQSKLNLVDLAGSERVKKSGAEGTRLDEGKAINSSLAVLGKVVRTLARGKEGEHVPFRDSKLTLLLRDSLGGNTKTVMIANICPTASHLGETVATLRYASEAARVRNRPRVVIAAPSDSTLRLAHEDVAVLRGQLLARLRGIPSEGLTRDQLRVLGERGELPGAAGTGTGAREEVRVRVVDTGFSQADLELALSRARAEEAALEGKTAEERAAAALRTRAAEGRLAEALAVLAQSKAAEAAEAEAIAAVRADLAAKQAMLLRGQGGLPSVTATAAAAADGSLSLPLSSSSSSPSSSSFLLSSAAAAAAGARAALAAAEAELSQRRQERHALEQTAARLEEERLLADDQYASAEAAVAALKEKLRRLFAKMQAKRAEAATAAGGFAAERQRYIELMHAIDKEVKLQSLVIESFVPSGAYAALDQARRWSPQKGAWVLPGLELSGNAKERERERLAAEGSDGPSTTAITAGTEAEAETGAAGVADLKELLRLYKLRGGVAEAEDADPYIEYPEE